MKKREFLEGLRDGLSGFPQGEVEERIAFYSEMIDDRMEEGCSEEEAVAEIGDLQEILAQLIGEISLTKLVKEKLKPRKLSAWVILLVALGSPIWLSLGIAAVAVFFALLASAGSVVISLWAAFASLAACFLGGVAAGIVLICGGHMLTGVAMIGAGVACAGLSIFAFFGCKAASKGLWRAVEKTALWGKKRMLRKEAAQ